MEVGKDRLDTCYGPMTVAIATGPSRAIFDLPSNESSSISSNKFRDRNSISCKGLTKFSVFSCLYWLLTLSLTLGSLDY